MIYQMAENFRGIRDHAENPNEILSVLLIFLTSMLYRGIRREDQYNPNSDLLKIITDYQQGAIPTFKDMLVKLGEEIGVVIEARDAKDSEERT
jgi:hypothetical protein